MPIKHMGDSGMMSDSQDPESDSEDQQEGGEGSEDSTATLDLDILQGQDVKPGDRVELEVVSVDPDMGSFEVKYPDKSKKPEDGIADMASEYDKQPTDS